MEPISIQPKSHTLLYAILITISVFFTPAFLLVLLTQLSISKYPTTITPSEEFCISGFFPFPNSYNIQSNTSLEENLNGKVTIFNQYDIFANQLCFTPTTLLPQVSNFNITFTYLENVNLDIFKKNIQISTEQYPQVKQTNISEEINNDELLIYEVDYFSSLIDYSLRSNDRTIPCNKETNQISCDARSLNLAQGGSYELTLIGTYSSRNIYELEKREVKILSSVAVISSNIQNKQVIQSPTVPEITVTFNKEIFTGFEIGLEDSEKNQISFESILLGDTITVRPVENLKQNTTYFLRMSNIVGLDGSRTEGEYELEFSIADGPKLKSTNIGTGFSTTGNMVLTFDQNIKNPQSIKSYIKLNSGTDYSYTISKNQITINPSNTLDSCTSYPITIAKGIVSTTGLVSSKSYAYSLKTKCQRIASIGTSVEGRSIYASYFGHGNEIIVFFGSMHGTESNTRTLLNRWIVELETNSSRIPSDKTIIVIPTFNPDGIANKTRFNANGVDLNRNFDSSSWVQGTYFLSDFYPLGGGTTPFSEPESVAIRNFVNAQSPYLTISYHSAAGCVIPTSSSSAVQFGRTYSQLSGYSYVNPGGAGAFTYDITGTFEEWADEHGKNALVVELSSLYSDQFTQNKNAMWEMVEQ